MNFLFKKLEVLIQLLLFANFYSPCFFQSKICLSIFYHKKVSDIRKSPAGKLFKTDKWLSHSIPFFFKASIGLRSHQTRKFLLCLFKLIYSRSKPSRIQIKLKRREVLEPLSCSAEAMHCKLLNYNTFLKRNIAKFLLEFANSDIHFYCERSIQYG